MWVFVFVLPFLRTGNTESGGTLQITPPVAAVRYGDTLSANCSTSESQVFGMGWESPFGGTGLVKNTSSVPFKVAKVQEWSMEPMCYITLVDKKQFSENLKVIVYQMPETVSLSYPKSEIVEGQQCFLMCDIVAVAPVDRLSVVWYKGKEKFHSLTFESEKVDFDNPVVNKTPSTNLTAHRDDDGTQIWCEAILSLKPAVQLPLTMRSNSYNMTVLYPPTFTHPANETVEVPPGGPITLNCTARGNPPPVYSWHFSYSSQETGTNQKQNGSIFTPSSERSGIYSCTVSNSLGRSTKYFTVVEEKRPRTVFGAILGGFLVLAVLLIIVGLLFVNSDGSFSCNKDSYSRGKPASSGPI